MKDGVVLTFGQLLALALVPALLTGIVGVVAGLLGPWLLEGRKQEAEKKRRRAEKFEELVTAIYEHEHWLEKFKNEKLFGEDQEIGMSPMAKVQAIATVYFPNMDEKIREMDVAASAYILWIMEERTKKLTKEPYAKEPGKAYRPYIQKLNALLNELKEFAEREFQ